MQTRNGSQNNKNGKIIEVHERLLLCGQFLTVVASGLLSFGKVLELFKNSELPSVPINENSKKEINNTSSLYSGRRSSSYFD